MFTFRSHVQPGRSHLVLRKDCQDRLCYRHGGGIHVMAISDGVGSRPLSEFGATALAQSASLLAFDKAREGLGPAEVGQSLLAEVPKILSGVVSVLGLQDPRDAGEATLLLCVLTPTWTCLWHSGDGFAAVDQQIFAWDVWAESKPLAIDGGNQWLHQVEVFDTNKIGQGVFLASDGLRHFPGGIKSLASRMSFDPQVFHSDRDFGYLFSSKEERLLDDVSVGLLLRA